MYTATQQRRRVSRPSSGHSTALGFCAVFKKRSKRHCESSRRRSRWQSCCARRRGATLLEKRVLLRWRRKQRWEKGEPRWALGKGTLLRLSFFVSRIKFRGFWRRLQLELLYKSESAASLREEEGWFRAVSSDRENNLKSTVSHVVGERASAAVTRMGFRVIDDFFEQVRVRVSAESFRRRSGRRLVLPRGGSEALWRTGKAFRFLRTPRFAPPEWGSSFARRRENHMGRRGKRPVGKRRLATPAESGLLLDAPPKQSSLLAASSPLAEERSSPRRNERGAECEFPLASLASSRCAAKAASPSPP